jgi:hypothetical protein
MNLRNTMLQGRRLKELEYLLMKRKLGEKILW